MGSLFTDGSFKRVFLPPCHHVFWPNVEIICTWLTNAGHTVTDSSKDCDIQIAFIPKNSRVLDPHKTPTVLVSTEQPMSPLWSRAGDTFLRAIHTFWCMDVVDFKFLHETYGIPLQKLCIVPVMMGTYVKMQEVRRHKTIDVLQFGEINARREQLMNEIEAVLQGKRIISTDNSWSDVLKELISTSCVVVVPHFFEEPNVFPVHRIMNVMQYPGVRVVVEDSTGSVYTRLLLQQFGDRVVFAKYENMVSAIKDVLDVEACTSGMRSDSKEPACIAGLRAWDGKTSWLQKLSTDVFDVTSL